MLDCFPVRGQSHHNGPEHQPAAMKRRALTGKVVRDSAMLAVPSSFTATKAIVHQLLSIVA